jgi:hypothetical protein
MEIPENTKAAGFIGTTWPIRGSKLTLCGPAFASVNENEVSESASEHVLSIVVT